ncbi:2,3-bisphosphoglycerate-independent phosphoglycerate mutase [Candidatus Parcubacteria bacterium]|nr:MAG: 2,3-bisphosphoglycerate-independent phosphoglycerate mutase [Candidatus Parcubacteria bacterium]
MNKSKNLPLILVILDGWGIDKDGPGNAISLAKTPTIDGLGKKYPFTKIYAHGKHVGLPDGQVGNSEAGHMNIGAGRLVEQDSVKISTNIEDGTFFKNPAFLGAIRHVKKSNSRLHIMGLLSNGQSPHSDPGHLMALIEFARKNNIKDVFLHLFTDGRDSPKFSSLNEISKLEKELKNEKIATIMGRYYAMDRKKKWERTELTYNTFTIGEGRKASSAQEAITNAYNRGNSDEFIEPHVIECDSSKSSRIEEGDSVIFFNLRSDRSRQLAKAFVQPEFEKMNPGSFKRKKKLEHLYFVAMTDFGPDLDDIITAYPSVDLYETLPMQFEEYTQMYIAETEKYAHVTYFFNGGYSGTVAGETQHLVPSPDVKSYDETPAMSSEELTKVVVDNIDKHKKSKKFPYEFVVLNFAAPDMVGHTGNLEAGIKCCEQVDKCVSQIVKTYLSVGGTVLITADHGNIEKMINTETGEIFTEHTTNQVPFLLVSKTLKKTKLRTKGFLGDIAPTILDILDLKKPKEMKGKSLILK